MLSRSVTSQEIDMTLWPGQGAEGGMLDVWLLEESYPQLPAFIEDRTGRDDHGLFHGSPSDDDGSEAPPQADAVVTGSVLTSDGAPVQKALLLLSWDGDSLQVAAGADGLFHAEVPRGRVSITARAPDFYGETEVLEVSGDRAAVDFTLTPAEEGITLSGRVLTADGEPVEGAAVWINNVLVHSVRGGGFTLVLPSHWTARWEITAEKEGVGRGGMTFDVQGRCMKGFEIRLGQETRQVTDFTPAPRGQR